MLAPPTDDSAACWLKPLPRGVAVRRPAALPWRCRPARLRVAMSRALALVPVVLVLALGVVLSGARQRPEFRGGTNTVSVFATALDENQRLVTDLSADDFEVFDNGVKQPITVFANDQQAITVVVMLDRSQSMQPHFGQLTEAANAFVDSLL